MIYGLRRASRLFFFRVVSSLKEKPSLSDTDKVGFRND